MFGLDLHPAVIHYPIALTVVGALALVAYASLRRSWIRWLGPILLTVALAGAGTAYFSGQAIEDKASDSGVPHDAIEQHESTAIYAIGAIALATLLAWATVAGRRGVWIGVPVALVAAGLVLWTAHLGGRLVFVHGAGRVPPEGVAPLPELPEID